MHSFSEATRDWIVCEASQSNQPLLWHLFICLLLSCLALTYLTVLLPLLQTQKRGERLLNRFYSFVAAVSWAWNTDGKICVGSFSVEGRLLYTRSHFTTCVHSFGLIFSRVRMFDFYNFFLFGVVENGSYLSNLCLLFGIACVTVMELERDLALRNAAGHL